MDKKIASIHPRKLARSMAKARTGIKNLRYFDWRRAAADQAKNPIKRGAKK